MNMNFIRIIFLCICMLLATLYATTLTYFISSPTILLIGAVSGLAFGFLLIGIDNFARKYNLRSFNIALIGLVLGYLMGEAIMLLLKGIFELSFWTQNAEILTLIKMGIFLSTTYFGMSMTARISDNLLAGIPFLNVKSSGNKKKDVIIDSSILTDSRLIELASSGLLDNQLVIPRFLLKELQSAADSGEEAAKNKARRSFEILKKLENLPTLNIRFIEDDFPDIKDPMLKLIKIAKHADADILTADIGRLQQPSTENVRFINIHIVSNALKPVSQAGEFINIKIQRYGKEPRQGIGYLEDGTMVVVNGGAEYIGETIKAQVLSVKHTSSGRMIFCNSSNDALISEQESAQTIADLENNSGFFAVP